MFALRYVGICKMKCLMSQDKAASVSWPVTLQCTAVCQSTKHGCKWLNLCAVIPICGHVGTQKVTAKNVGKSGFYVLGTEHRYGDIYKILKNMRIWRCHCAVRSFDIYSVRNLFFLCVSFFVIIIIVINMKDCTLWSVPSPEFCWLQPYKMALITSLCHCQFAVYVWGSVIC